VIRIATRNSALAKAQAGQVAALLGGAELLECSSDGEAGDKARFVRGVERALLDGDADIGVHSAKDLPAEMPDGLAIAAVPVREDPADVWIESGGGPAAGTGSPRERVSSSGAGGSSSEVGISSPRPNGSSERVSLPPGPEASLNRVPEGTRVGTASLRRRAQLLAARPDLEVSELHGNVDTRLRKLAEGELDAIVLAAAGLRRLGRAEEASFAIPAEEMIPAAGQGALVLQARGEDEEALQACAAIGDETALRELTAERAVVALLEATCATPIGVHARVGGDGSPAQGGAEGESGERTAARPRPKSRAGAAGEARPGAGGRTAGQMLTVEAFVGLPDGSEWIRDRVEGDAGEPAALGALLAERLLAAGARDILDRAEGWKDSNERAV
jgi:hydroxymethylbilane synthase